MRRYDGTAIIVAMLMFGAATLAPHPVLAAGSGHYWLAGADGGVFAYGRPYHGSTGDRRLNSPVVDVASTTAGSGYWLVAGDGGVFSFGSAAGRDLAAPVVAMASTGVGYLLAGADGSVHAFGGASAMGSLAGTRLADPIVDIEMFSSGYWLVTAGGEVFAFGDAASMGTGPRPPLAKPVVGMAAGTGLPAGDSILPGTYHERADEFSSVAYADGVPGSVEVLHGDCFCRHRVWMAALWHPEGDGSAQLTAHLTNTAGVPLRFPEGLQLQVTFEATN